MDVERARELLAAERRRLERTLAHRPHQEDGEESDPFFNPANLAANLYQEEVEEGLAEDLRAELAAVERAEQRLAAGTYGLSIESGLPIPDARLEAVPTAELTVEEERARTESWGRARDQHSLTRWGDSRRAHTRRSGNSAGNDHPSSRD